jgi:hypothetical protein
MYAQLIYHTSSDAVVNEYFALRRLTRHTPAFCWAVACGMFVHPDYPKA